MKKNKKKLVWLTDVDTMLEIYKLAKKNGKKAGDNIVAEFNKVMKKKKIKLIGITESDIDMITGNLREQGKKILNLNEIQRRKRRKQ